MKKINESDSIKVCGDYERRVQNQMRDYFKISGVTNINHLLPSDSENTNDHVEFLLQEYGFNLLLGAYCSPDKKIDIDYFKTTLLQLEIKMINILKLYAFFENLREFALSHVEMKTSSSSLHTPSTILSSNSN